MWEIFRRKARAPQKVTTGRCEIKRNGEVAFLEYSLAGNIVELNHTEVPVFGVRVRCAEAVNSLAPGVARPRCWLRPASELQTDMGCLLAPALYNF